MAQLIVRNLEKRVVERLKASALRHRRSLEAEVRCILGAAAARAALDWDEARGRLDTLRDRLGGRTFPDLTELIREDRE